MRNTDWWVLGAVVVVTGVLFIDWCGVVFQCGCQSLWAGASLACNIHHESPPHCPWCAHPFLGGGTAFGATVLAQWLVVSRRERLGALPRFVLALAAFPVVSGVAAWLQAWLWSYRP